MKFVFTLLTLIAIFFGGLFLFIQSSSAQDIIGTSIPGITCGMAGADNGRDSCCNTKANTNIALPLGIPDFGGAISSLKKKMNDMSNWQNNAQQPCIYGKAQGGGSSCKCVLSTKLSNLPVVDTLCKKYLTGTDQQICSNCAQGGGLWTGMGCIPLEIGSFITDFLLGTMVGFAGIIALLCIIYSAFMMQTSQGNPEKIKKAQANLTACVSGLLLILFSIFILRLIGINILRIPGFQSK